MTLLFIDEIQESDLTKRIDKFIEAVLEGELVVKDPHVSRNGIKFIDGFHVEKNGDCYAYVVTPNVSLKFKRDGKTYYVRINKSDWIFKDFFGRPSSKEIYSRCPTFLEQMAKEPYFSQLMKTHPFIVKRLNQEHIMNAEAYVSIKNTLAKNDDYLNLMNLIETEWELCEKSKDHYVSEHLKNEKVKIKYKKAFAKKLSHFLQGQPDFVSDVSNDFLYDVVRMDPDFLKSMARFVKRNRHDIVITDNDTIKDACDEAKVLLVMKS